MLELGEQTILCPYCGESIHVLIDTQDVGEQYIEDCQVCCKPIVFNAYHDALGEVYVTVHDENDVC